MIVATTTNSTMFAIAYRRATFDLMDAVAAQSPSDKLASATRSAERAWCLAANIIEETLAGDLIDAIAKVKPMVMA